MFLGIRAVLAKSFARIHLNNLINYGILPLVFENPEDYLRLEQGDLLTFSGVRKSIRRLKVLEVRRGNEQKNIRLLPQITANKIEVLLSGGLLPYLRKKLNENFEGVISESNHITSRAVRIKSVITTKQKP
jgi:aconitate hydratase